MGIEINIAAKIILILCKDLTKQHTITSLAKEVDVSRVGVWKSLQKLKQKKYILIESIGIGKTNTSVIKINWSNILVIKALALHLTEEAVVYQRWRVNFKELEPQTSFTILFGSILHSPTQAQDIDIVNIASQNHFIKIAKAIEHIQSTQIKKLHIFNFTPAEFKQELYLKNKAFIEAIKKGVVLFGQENFIQFMRDVPL